MHILMVGDIVGAPGRKAFARVVTRKRQAAEVDFVVANAENSAGGRGLTETIAEELFAAGADALTLGDHTWDQREIQSLLEKDERIVRPINFSPSCPGRGYTTVKGPGATRITIANAIGRTFMRPYDCPFMALDAALSKGMGIGDIVLVDFHAEATSEKIVMGRYLDGRVGVVVGTHTHVQTSDETILPKGTAYITDLGMTGAKDSALGRDLDAVTSSMLTGMPTKFDVASDDVVLEGLLVTTEAGSCRVKKVKRIREKIQ